jgi:nucleoid-associated protein YgaU
MSVVATDGGLDDATIRVENGREAGAEITAMFNPTEYSRNKSVEYGEQTIAGLSAPVAQFVSGGAETLSMELFFDTSESRGDVTEQTDRLDVLLTVDDTLGAPPFCTFVWGDGIAFKAVLESAEKQFTMFRPDGTPVRARVNVTFKQYRPPSGGSGGGSESSGSTRRRTVTAGDTLWSIAGEEYGDPGEWKRIASANGVEDPRSLQPGTRLTIPSGSG